MEQFTFFGLKLGYSFSVCAMSNLHPQQQQCNNG